MLISSIVSGACAVSVLARGKSRRRGFWGHVALVASLFLGGTALAQQAQFENPSFEEFAPGYNPNVNYRITNPSNVVGWNSVRTSNGTIDRIEHWRDNFLGVPAQEGRYFIELNPSRPNFLYQDVCLVENARLNWSFWHRARAGGPAVQGVEFMVADADNDVVQMLGSSSLPVPTNNAAGDWRETSGSSVFTGATGSYRLGFRSTNNGSFGNLMDNINASTIAQVQFLGTAGQSVEGTSSGGIPVLAVSGNVEEDTDVEILVAPSSTATLGDDFVFTSTVVTIPMGVYDGVSDASRFPLPITIVDDAIPEDDETLTLTTGAITSTANGADSTGVQFGDIGCTTPASGPASFTIFDNDAALEIEKTVSDIAANVQAGDQLTYTFEVTNPGFITVNDVTPVEQGVVIDGTAGTGTLSDFTLVTEAGFVSDDIDGNDRVDALARNEVAKFTATYTLTSADIAAMRDADAPTTAIDNAATATGTPASGVLAPVTPSVVETGVLTPGITLEKAVSSVEDTNNSGLYGDVGDTVNFIFKATNTGNAALAEIVVTDTDLAALTGVSTLTQLDVTLPRDATGVTVATATYVLAQADVALGQVVNSASVTAQPVDVDGAGNPDPNAAIAGLPPVGDDSDTASDPLLNADGSVTPVVSPATTDSNGIAGDDGSEPTVLFLIPSLSVTKTTTASTVIVGQSVPYVITVSSTQAVPLADVTIVDTLPVGLVYTPGTASIDGTFVEPVIAGQSLSFEGLTLPAGTPISISLSARVTASAPTGDLTNIAQVLDGSSGTPLAAVASATVTRRPEAVFECSHVIGKVFDDINMNGYQDGPAGLAAQITDQDIFVGKLSPTAAEPRPEIGIPGVRLVTPTGTVITTDAHGRYSVPCAEMPAGIGSNFMLKLDTRSLPTGYRVTTENPRVMRLTSGIMTEMNFGAAIGRVLDVDLSDAAFVAGDANVPDMMQDSIDQVLRQIADTPTIIRVSYYRGGEAPELARARLDAVEEAVQDAWSDIGAYRLLIEKTLNQLQ